MQADPARLRQVFCNLFNNAVKFTPSQGTIFIRTADLDGWLRVEVSDTGPGIESHKLSRIFDAFEQATATPNSTAGLGLGLAICKALVDLHGGIIEAHSAGPNTGSSFIVKLPSSAAEKIENLPDPIAISHSAPISILLVEDHRDTVESLRLLLLGEGYQVHTATSVARALEVAENQGFDLLISDIGLPDGSGTDLLIRLKSATKRRIVGIALSGFGMEDDLKRSQEAGFAEHLTKPVDYTILQQAITRLLA